MAAGVAVASLVTFAVTTPGSAAPQQAAPFGAGTGSATALVYKVNPLFGGLSFGITAGESVAGHQNTGAQAQSKAVNLGVIGVTLAGEGCEGSDPTLPAEAQPQPVVVNSDDPGAEQGTTETLGEAISMTSRATKTPFSEAITSVAPIGDRRGIYVSAGTARATSGVVGEGVREARAITEIGELSLLNGLIRLQGLRWEAVQRTGADTQNSGTFTIADVHIGPTVLPFLGGLLGALLDEAELLDEALAALGIILTPPEVRVEQGIVFVDPLKVGLGPSKLRDELVGRLLRELQPVREEVVDALMSISCGEDPDILGNNGKTVITVLDLALATISGAGSTTLEIGGVQATTAEIAGFTGLGEGAAAPSLPPLVDVTPAPSNPISPAIPAMPGRSGPATLEVPAASAAPISSTPGGDDEGERGGLLLGVGLGGLLLLLATAEADRRKMVRAQREISLEA